MDADGRLTDLLSRLNIEATEVRRVRDADLGKPRGFGFVEMSGIAADTAIDIAIRARQEGPQSQTPGNSNAAEPTQKASKGGGLESASAVRPGEGTEVLSASLLAHAVDTFGSEQIARKWLSSECGALNNRTPLQVIQGESNEAEVERILDCIDYGMLA